MTAFAFSYGPKVRAGPGIVMDAASLLPPGPVLLVTDANVRALGLCDALIADLETRQRRVGVFDAVEADPSDATVEAAARAAVELGAVAVVGVGGGSPLDVAKLVAYLVGSGDRLDAIYGVEQAKGARLPLVLVPTTAGTGSEATPIAIVTTGVQKKGVVSAALSADWALLDARLTVGLPSAVTAATGIDAMVHALEAFTSARLKNPLSDMLARQALGLLATNLPTAVRDGANLAAREAMLLGSHLAGVAFANAPVGGIHALAYPLGGQFHVAHGLSNALMMPHVMRHNLGPAASLYAELALLLDPSLSGRSTDAAAEALVERFGGLAGACGLPTSLRDVGVGADDLDRLADDAMLQTRLLANNPRPITRDDAWAMYEAAL